MKRREFITFLGGSAAWPLPAHAQQRALPVVGWLDTLSLEARCDGVAAFHAGLQEAGYRESQNIAFEYRWAEGLAHLVNPANPNAQSDAKDVQSAAGLLRLQFNILNVSPQSDIDLAFATIARQQLGGVLVANDPFLNNGFNQIAPLALTLRVPTFFPHREAVTVGGLISYGPSRTDNSLARQSGIYTGRILKSEKPADLPVVQATKFEFAINLQTARLLGIDVPPTLLALADEVIE
jgi:putative ABC transport system substrate-binding protein